LEEDSATGEVLPVLGTPCDGVLFFAEDDMILKIGKHGRITRKKLCESYNKRGSSSREPWMITSIIPMEPN
jgi:hypothetical protein